MLEERNEDIKKDKQIAQAEVILPTTLPIIHINNAPLFPGLMAPVMLPGGPLVKAMEIALSQNGIVALLMTKETKNTAPTINDLHTIGVTARVLKKINMGDGGASVLLQGIKRFKVLQFIKDSPFVIAKIEYLEDIVVDDLETQAMVRTVRSMVKNLSSTSPLFSEEMRLAMINVPTPGMMADLVMFTLGVDSENAQKYLETQNVKERFRVLIAHLKKEQELSELQAKLTKEVNDKITTMQREFFLKEQLKAIRKELGLEQDEKTLELNKLKEKFKNSGISEEGRKVVEEELSKLSLIPEASPEYAVTRNYIDWLVSLPWSRQSKDELNIKKARKVLDKHHYGLEKVKDRILEYLAVRRLNPEYEGNILLFLGPPGVGKTSLGMAIAESMGRKFYRFSLGGMRDEAEIKGHRRTYVGAMPGKIMQGLKRVVTKNPVVMLDEVDKLSISFQGDPASALLEVLDPEQNFNFVDHYIDVGFDLSQVLFICTANTNETIPAPLLDRMEVIQFPGYIMDEKLEITKDYLMPKLLKKHGIKKEQVSFSKDVLVDIINKYARDPGIRMLEKNVAKILRKIALRLATGKRGILEIKKGNLTEFLGPSVFNDDPMRRIDVAGIATGLAWTAYGGDVLFIESTAIKGSEGFKYTGQLGDVMKESAQIAFTYARHWIAKKDPKNKFFAENNVHLHIPAGATPKDGPSAGVTMCSSLISLAMNIKMPNDLAMTGELSLTGRVLPVGGIKEKVIAAVRAGVKRVILPEDNEKDVKEIPKHIQEKVKFFYVREMGEILIICIK